MWHYPYLGFNLGLPEYGLSRPMPPPDDHHLINVEVSQRGRSKNEPETGDQTSDEPTDYDSYPLWPLEMCQSAYCEIQDYFRAREPEAAGLLLGPTRDDPVVTHFVPDEDGDSTAATFHLSAAGLNRVLQRVKPAGLDCKGIIHSHPSGVVKPSSGDLAYLRRLFDRPANADVVQCFVPIFCDRRLYPYVYAQGRLWLAELILI